MTINEMIKELEEIRERNREPEVPNFDPGTLEIRIQSQEGTFESEIVSVEQANDVWLIVDEPNYEDL
jgi:hypothetical protein